MKFSWEEDFLPKLQNYIFFFYPRNLFLLNYVFSRPSITSVICLSNNNIIFTETILKIETRSLKPFPCGNCEIEFPRNILKVAKIDSHAIFVKAQFKKINSREILKAQMAKINYREMPEKKNSLKLVPANIISDLLSKIVIFRHLSNKKIFKKDHEARKMEPYKFYCNMSVENTVKSRI